MEAIFHVIFFIFVVYSFYSLEKRINEVKNIIEKMKTDHETIKK